MKALVEVSTMLDKRATGIGRYTGAIVHALHQLAKQPSYQFELAFLYKVSRHKLGHLLPQGKRQLWALHRLRHSLGAQNADCVLWPHTFHPVVRAKGLVCVVQDLHALHGVNYDATNAAARAENLQALHDFAKHSSQFIFSSDYVRTDFLQHFSVDPQRTHVVPHGVAPAFFPRDKATHQTFMEKHGLARPFFLFAGSPRPSKNLIAMLTAFAASHSRNTHDVVVVGKMGDDRDGLNVKATIAQLGIASQVHLIGYVSDADLAIAFSAADGLLFASHDEGFGLPILEAMAAGTPVLTSTVTSCPEVAGGHAVLVDPHDVDAMRAGIDKLLTLQPPQLEAARTYAAAMTWERSARGTLDVLRLAAQDTR